MYEKAPRLRNELPLQRTKITNRLDAYDIPYVKEIFDVHFTDEQIVSYLTDTLNLDYYGIGLEDLLA